MAVYQIVTYFIVIVGFVSATQYFSAKPSMRVNVTMIHPVLVEPHRVQKFYRTTSTVPAEAIVKNSFLGKLFEEPKMLVRSDIQPDFTNPLYSLAKSAFIPEVIADLENYLEKYSYQRLLAIYVPSPGYELRQLKPYLESVKAELTPKDYGTLLGAVIYARTIQNYVDITNNGGVDLRHIVLTIYGPMTKTTDSRENNILRVQPNIIHAYDIKKYGDKVEIHLPLLRKNHGFQLMLYSRENRVTEHDVLYSFEEDRTIGYKNLAVVCIISLLFIIVVGLLCKGGKREGRRDEGWS